VRKVLGVVFDLDGVLIDSTACHRAAFDEVLRSFGVVDFDYPRYAGWRTPEVIESELRRVGRPVDHSTIAIVAAQKSRIAREKLVASNPVRGECFTVLRELAVDYSLALASSGSRESVELFLATNACWNLFRSILTGDDVTRAKPDAEIYRRTFIALGLEPRDCVVVEDAAAGIQAAVSAGGVAVGFRGTCSRETLRAAGAAYVVDGLSELSGLLSQI